MDFIAGDMDIGVFSRLWKKTEKKPEKQTSGRREQGPNRNESSLSSSLRRDPVASWRESQETLDGTEGQRTQGIPESSRRGSFSSIYSATSDAPTANSRRSNMDQWNLSMELAMTQVTSDITSLRHFCKEMVLEMSSLKTACAEMSTERQSVVDLCQQLTSRLQSENEVKPTDEDIFSRSSCPDLIEKSLSSESQLKNLSENISEIKQSVEEISKHSVLLKSEINSQHRIVKDECQSIAADHVYLKKMCEELISQSQKTKKGDKNQLASKGDDLERLHNYMEKAVIQVRSDIQALQKDMHESEKQWPKLIRSCVLEAKDYKQNGLLNQLAQMESSLIEIQSGHKQGTEAMLRKVESIVDKSARKVLNESKAIFKEQTKEDKTSTNVVEEKKDPSLDFSVKKILHGAKKSSNENQFKDLKICFSKDGSRRSEETEKELELSQITFKKQSVLKTFDLASDDLNSKGKGNDLQTNLNQASQNVPKKELMLSVFEPGNEDITRNATRLDFFDLPIKSKPTSREVTLASSPRPPRVFKSNSLVKECDFSNIKENKSDMFEADTAGKVKQNTREVIVASSARVTKFFGPYSHSPAENISQSPFTKKSDVLDIPQKNFLKFKPNPREVIIAEGSFPQKIFRPRSLSTHREGHINTVDTPEFRSTKVKPTQREVILAPKTRSRAQSEDRPTKRRPRAKSADRSVILRHQSSSSSSPVDDVIAYNLPGVRETEHRRLWQICNIKSLCRTQMVKLGPSIRVQELDFIFQCFFQKNWTLVLKLAPKSPEQFDRVVYWPVVVKVVVELIEDAKVGATKLLCQKDVVIPRRPKHDIEALAIDSVSRKRLSPHIDKDDVWLRVKAYPVDKKPGQ